MATEKLPTDDTVTLVGAEKLQNGVKVSKNGQAHVGREYAGQRVTIAVKPEPTDDEPNNEDSND